jgi:hypothetical protein
MIVLSVFTYLQVLVIPVKGCYWIFETLPCLVFTLLHTFELNDTVILPEMYVEILSIDSMVCVGGCVCMDHVCFILHPRRSSLIYEISW